jgi:7-carboxy-7-deazaguanine synthase
MSEVYRSVQGEGPRVGGPTVFVRFAGCNLKCPGWPCDTPHAIDPAKYRHEWTNTAEIDVVHDIANKGFAGTNVCYTGGEPFLQDNRSFYKLVQEVAQDLGAVQEVFTNGTLEFPTWAVDELYFVMDWKLPGSGEDMTRYEAMRWENLHSLSDIYGNAIKFTITDRNDFLSARLTWEEMLTKGIEIDVYAGIVWGKLENKTLVEWMQESKLPWKLNVQQHNYIWDRTQRGI